MEKTRQMPIASTALLERAERMQLLAQSVGTIAPEHAREAHDFLLKPGIVNGSFNALARDFIND